MSIQRRREQIKIEEYVMKVLSVITVLSIMTSACFALPTVNINRSSDNSQHTDAVASWNTYAVNMVGMTIKATFGDSSTETVTWTTLPSGGYNAYGANGITVIGFGKTNKSGFFFKTAMLPILKCHLQCNLNRF